MKKKLLAVLTSAVFAFGLLGLTGCGSDGEEEASWYGEDFDAFSAAIDPEFTKEVNETIAGFGDDEATGMRSAGSPAELETAEYLEGVMKKIGLKNVTLYETELDSWTFNGANITFTNAKGEKKKIDLAGYQTDIKADNREVELVYVNRGTEEDYEGLDVTGKLVLFEINQEEDWWINYPAYQAKVNGALCAIAMREFAEEDEDGNRIGVQDVCGPADAPALAISRNDAEDLKKAIKDSGDDSIKVTFNADSQVTKGGTSHNVFGEIPGKTPETIFVFSHMDGYFHSIYDDAQGVAVSMAIAKGLMESGYTPDKTIRFCVHGAEEWGVEGSEYDWSTGAYEEIMTNYPEWVDGAFCIVNNDGGYAVDGEKYKGTNSSIELKEFVKGSIGEFNKEGKYEWSYDNLSTYTEDFQWTRVGIPAIVAGDGKGTAYYNMAYHSNYDSWEYMPLDEEGLNEVIATFGKIVIDLDARDVRPMNFKARIKSFEKSLNEDAKEQFADVIAEGYKAAEALQAKMETVEDGDDKEAAIKLNEQTQEIYVAFQDALLGLDFINVDAIIRHDLYEDNLDSIDASIEALEKGNVQEAYDEYLWAIDWTWYDMVFDKETCDYMKKQLFDNREGTWGEGLIRYPHADTNAIVVSLRDKYDEKDADLTREIAALKVIREQQYSYLKNTYAEELAGLEKAVELMNRAAE